MRRSLLRVLLVNVLVLVGMLLALELAARLYVAWTRGSQTAGLAERTAYLSYQPFVMYGPEWDDRLSPARSPVRDGVCRLLLVGGSTAGFFPSVVLEDSMRRAFAGHRFEVINAAWGGYEARQEVVVASIWGPGLSPHLLVSLDGANDLSHRLRTKRAGHFYLDGAYELYLSRPFLAPFAYVLGQSQLYGGLVRSAQRRSLGTADHYSDAIPVYIEAQRSLNRLARGMGAARLMVLQPFSAFKTPLSPEEAAFTLYQYREPVVKELYARAHVRLAALAAADGVTVLDGRSVFDGVPERAFTDDVHLTELGYRKLADAIAASLATAFGQRASFCGRG